MEENKEIKLEEIDTVKAKEAIELEKKRRETNCSMDIQEALIKHNCFIDVGIMVKPNANVPMISITAKP